MKTDILFVHPGGFLNQTHQSLARKLSAIDVPVWALLLAQHARNRGYSASIYDSGIEGWTADTARTLLERHNPDLIVIMVYGHNPSASTQSMPSAILTAQDIKKADRSIPLAIGGIHPTALPERTLDETGADYVLRGEGTGSITGLLSYIQKGYRISSVPGLCYRTEQKTCFTEPAQDASDLDIEYSGYAWDLLPDLNHYRAHNWHCFQESSKSRKDDLSDVRSPYVSLYTALGCPFHCSFCCVNSIFSTHGIRYWSIEKVLSWLHILSSEYKVRNIRIADELFVFNPKRVERFCDELINRDYGLNIWVYGRVDTIGRQLLRKMKAAGINWIALGIESACETVRRAVNKPIKTDIKRTVQRLQAHDISVVGNYLFGLPDDSPATVEETLSLALELRCEFANFNVTMAYPGSELYRQVKDRPDTLPARWEGFAQLGPHAHPLPTKYMSSKEVLAFRDRAFRRYFSDRDYLSSMEKRFGSTIAEHIAHMLDVPLERRLLHDDR